jgi:hypothetical protein
MTQRNPGHGNIKIAGDSGCSSHQKLISIAFIGVEWY